MFLTISRLYVLRTALALALLAGFLATPIGIAHAFHAGPDPCDAPFLSQDPDSARLDPSGGREGHGHGFTCHWLQSLRSALVAVRVVVRRTPPRTCTRR